MSRIIAFLLGTDKVVTGPGSSWEFSFATPWALVWFIAAALVILAGVIALYWRESVPLTTGQRLFFVGMRALVVAVVLVMLGEPSIFVSTQGEGRAITAVVVDVSESMGVRDAYQDEDLERRTARAAGLLPESAPKTVALTEDDRRRLHDLTRAKIAELALRDPKVDFLGRLAEYYDVALYAFDANARRLTLVQPPAGKGAAGRTQAVPVTFTPDLVPEGRSTDLALAVRTAIKDARSQERTLAAAIVLSDGRATAGEPLQSLAAYAKQIGVPVYAVPVGDPTQPKDVRVAAIIVNSTLFVDDPTQVNFVLESSGFDGQKVRVELLDGERLIQGKDVTLVGGGKQQRDAFNFKPDVPGKRTYTVQVRPLAEELIEANNSAAALVDVIKGKIKVLMVEGLPRWEYRFLKNSLMRDDSLQVSCLLSSAEFDFIQEGNLPIDRFPDKEETLFKYNVIILGDVDPTIFTPTQVDLMKEFVERMGGGICFIAGEKNMPRAYRGGELGKIIPVIYDASREVGVNTTGLRRPYRLELTEEGKDNSMMLLADDPQESATLWRTLPPMFWYFPVKRPKPGATVLAVATGRDPQPVPLVVSSFYGAGRVMYVGCDEFWRWRYGVEDKYFYRFWGQILRYLNAGRQVGQSQRFQITTYKPDYVVGEEVMIRARLLDRSYHPLVMKAAEATLVLPGGEEMKVALEHQGGGVYEGAVRAIRPGPHDVRLTNPRPELEGEKAGYSFLVKRPDVEFRNTCADPDALAKLALATGAQAFAIDELGPLADGLRAQRRIRIDRAQFPLWDAPLFFIIFLGAICAEWVYRKRQRLL